MQITGVYFIYGLCCMFYFMMAWLFWRKGSDRLSRLVVVLMSLIGLQCIKDLFFLDNVSASIMYIPVWTVVTAVDMISVPIYAFILIELCRPGWLTKKLMILHEFPFILLPLLLIFTGNKLFYDIEVALAAVYGFGYATWTVFAISRYHKMLRERFSYDENINLNWLRTILFSFFIILGLWIVDCTYNSLDIESVYLLGSLIIWIFIGFFIYKHESVIDELRPVKKNDEYVESFDSVADLGARVTSLFITEKLYLNPKLKLSDVAKIVGTNRTYLSNFFNRTAGSTFYDYVNGLRLDHAEKLLVATSDSQTVIAEMSGFNSLSTFRRAFDLRHHCSPSEYRKRYANI